MKVPNAIFFSLVLTVSVDALYCFDCTFHQKTCLDVSAGGVKVRVCRNGEVCYKDVLYPISDKIYQTDFRKDLFNPKVSRGCRNRTYNSEDTSLTLLGECEFKEEFNKPYYHGLMCLCSDNDLCNGAETFRNVNFFIHRLVLIIISFAFLGLFAY